jgi:hypothetical protein
MNSSIASPTLASMGRPDVDGVLQWHTYLLMSMLAA